jgi:hypothetical protein
VVSWDEKGYGVNFRKKLPFIEDSLTKIFSIVQEEN